MFVFPKDIFLWCCSLSSRLHTNTADEKKNKNCSFNDCIHFKPKTTVKRREGKLKFQNFFRDVDHPPLAGGNIRGRQNLLHKLQFLTSEKNKEPRLDLETNKQSG